MPQHSGQGQHLLERESEVDPPEIINLYVPVPAILQHNINRSMSVRLRYFPPALGKGDLTVPPANGGPIVLTILQKLRVMVQIVPGQDHDPVGLEAGLCVGFEVEAGGEVGEVVD